MTVTGLGAGGAGVTDAASSVAGAGATSPLAQGTLGPLMDPGGRLAGNAPPATPDSGIAPGQQFLIDHFGPLGGTGGWLSQAGNAAAPLLSAVQGAGGSFYNVPAVTPQGQPLAGEALLNNATQLGMQNFPPYPSMEAATAALGPWQDLLRQRLAAAGATA